LYLTDIGALEGNTMLKFGRLAIVRLAQRSTFLALVLAAVATATQPAAALLITPTFTSSITSNPNAASIESAINVAIGTIDSLYSNPGTVNLVFSAGSGNFLAESDTFDYGYSYSARVC
jgi:hypothetical protein